VLKVEEKKIVEQLKVNKNIFELNKQILNKNNRKQSQKRKLSMPGAASSKKQ
jgi:hypothetical protein